MTAAGVLVAAALIPVLVGACSAWVLPLAIRSVRPALAALLLTGLALTIALGTGLVLCLTAYLGTAELWPAAHPSDWSAPALRRLMPIPSGGALAAGLLAAYLVVRAVAHLVTVVVQTRQAAATASLLPGVGELVIVDDPAVHAFAVPGGVRRIVVSTGLLLALPGPQVRAVLAHERSHIRHRHHIYVQLTQLAAAANPLVLPIVRAVQLVIERWADADAVRAVGDTRIVAHALGRAALAGAVRPVQPPRLGVAGSDVVERVRDLLEPPDRRTWSAAVIVLAIVVCWVSTAVAVFCALGIVELAELAS